MLPKPLLIVLSLLIILGGAYFALPYLITPSSTQVACTTDAMMCPDGSYVGRTGPKCEFICPQGATTTSASAGLNQTITGILGVKITPLEVLEDSRCPLDVQCIQAGTVRLRATFTDGLGTSTVIFKLGEAVTGEATVATLTKVTPDKYSKIKMKTDPYQFTFAIKKRI